MDTGYEKRKNLRFSKSQRLLKHPEYLRLAQKSNCVHGHFFLSRYLPGQTVASRIGITVSKRVGSAVVRNRIKRLAREYYRCHHSEILKKPWDINFIAKPGASTASHLMLWKDIDRLLRFIESTAPKK